MRIGIPRELKPREGRVGLIPAACVELVRGGAFGFEWADLLRFAFLVCFALVTWRVAIHQMRKRLID